MLKSGFAALALVATASCPAALAQDTVGTLAGVITDARGAPVAGAFVQMKNAERRLNFMVITQEQGKYSSSRLPAGKYVVQAIGGEHQSAPSTPVDVAAGKSSSVDLTLAADRLHDIFAGRKLAVCKFALLLRDDHEIETALCVLHLDEGACHGRTRRVGDDAGECADGVLRRSRVQTRNRCNQRQCSKT